MKYTVAVIAAIAAFATYPSAGFEPAKRAAQETTSAPEDVSACQETVVGPFKLSIVEGKDEKQNASKVEVSPLSHWERNFAPLSLLLGPSPMNQRHD